MRINFLSIIACFLFVSIAVSSCLDSEDNFVASSDATVHAFGLDTIHGKYYKFAIDQIERKIYNLEPLPVGADTLIDSILIDTFQVSGFVTSGLLDKDTLVNLSNHQNLRGASNLYTGGDVRPSGDLLNGLKFKITAADMTTTREYTLHISIYKNDPDSMRWEKMDITGLPAASTANKQKAVVLNNQLMLYVLADNEVKLFQNQTTDYSSWSEHALSGITLNEVPAIVKQAVWNTPKASQQEVLCLATHNQVFQSTDGINWTILNSLVTPAGYTLKKLISTFNGSLIGLFSQAEKLYLIPSIAESNTWDLNHITKLPAGFPTEEIYSATYQTANLLDQLVLVGQVENTAEKIIPWAYDGKNWTSLDPETTFDSYCLTKKIGYKPAIMHYDGKFYMLGERLDYIYASKNRLAWYQADKKFFLPKEIALRGNYTMTIDNEQYIWLISGGCSNPGQDKNEVWRGRLNKIGYEK